MDDEEMCATCLRWDLTSGTCDLTGLETYGASSCHRWEAMPAGGSKRVEGWGDDDG